MSTERNFSDITLIDEHNGLQQGRFISHGKKIYKVLGFDSENPEKVYCQRVLKRTLKISGKQPIFEVFTFIDFPSLTCNVCKTEPSIINGRCATCHYDCP